MGPLDSSAPFPALRTCSCAIGKDCTAPGAGTGPEGSRPGRGTEPPAPGPAIPRPSGPRGLRRCICPGCAKKNKRGMPLAAFSRSSRDGVGIWAFPAIRSSSCGGGTASGPVARILPFTLSMRSYWVPLDTTAKGGQGSLMSRAMESASEWRLWVEPGAQRNTRAGPRLRVMKRSAVYGNVPAQKLEGSFRVPPPPAGRCSPDPEAASPPVAWPAHPRCRAFCGR